MKLTKWEHSCLDIEEGGQRLVIDPGVYSPSLANFDKICGLVITHVHPDHYNNDVVQKIITANPDIQVLTTQEVVDDAKNPAVVVAAVGQTYKVGSFNLEFFGGQHATISPDYPTNQNVGVLVNDQLYYPGDSLTACPKPHTVLAVPIMAPWLKFSEAAEFVKADLATTIFPTHNGFINQDGQALMDRLMGNTAQAANKTYQFLDTGTNLEI